MVHKKKKIGILLSLISIMGFAFIISFFMNKELIMSYTNIDNVQDNSIIEESKYENDLDSFDVNNDFYEDTGQFANSDWIDKINKLFMNRLTQTSSIRGRTSHFLATTDGAFTETIDYYTLTLNKGTGITSVNGAATYLKNQIATISATPNSAAGYSFNNWTVNTGTSPASSTNASTTVNVNKETSLTANAADTTKPVVTITRTDYNTFSWTATDGVGVTG